VEIKVNKDELSWYDEKTECFVSDSHYEIFAGTSHRELVGSVML
jgi:hypothetical protein